MKQVSRRSVLAGLMPGAASAQGAWLLTEAEAGRIAAGPDMGGARGRTLNPGGDSIVPFGVAIAGPGLEVLKPSRPRVANPLDLHLRFVPRGADPDLSTLAFVVSVGTPTGFRGAEDIAPRLRKYLSGQELIVPRHYLPKRRYRFEVRLADLRGRKSAWRFEIDVAG